MDVFVTLGGGQYRIPKLTLGQVEDLICFAEENPEGETTRARLQRGRAMAALLFRFADPPTGDLAELQATHAELRAAADQVMRANGLARPADETGKAPAPDAAVS